mmetsp:Transcript_21782/g.27756  ORF Transcript_21782/g.27756 Transcript_21782/m.27756 type:complete len:188 (-) Transcript_21782:13-576(-)
MADSFDASAQVLEELIIFILGERRIYPTSYFQQLLNKKYNLTTYHINEENLAQYFRRFRKQLLPLLRSKSVQRVELIFQSVASEKIIETWNFSLLYPTGDLEEVSENFTSHVTAIFRQIQNTMAFLPLISTEICKFDILVHCDKSTKTSSSWEAIGPGIIPDNHNTDQLRSVSSKEVTVSLAVSYRD